MHGSIILTLNVVLYLGKLLCKSQPFRNFIQNGYKYAYKILFSVKASIGKFMHIIFLCAKSIVYFQETFWRISLELNPEKLKQISKAIEKESGEEFPELEFEYSIPTASTERRTKTKKS